RMNSDEGLRWSLEKLAAELAIFLGEENFFSEIDNLNSKFFDGSRELPRGMVARFDDLGGPPKEILNTTPTAVTFKDPIRSIQLADDQVETREIICQFCRELRILCEEAGERSVFD